ncbi:hypothetical protein M501DRAFT_994431 [Patellaria atrata CBS 101060]|uniref:Fungal N-terminal domain-containing protein n=1 Tax=Patellaria atrata CBS 101060 TaxID=1346257 RepID=A0A9P4VS08_9PEZI|nr:hypothetical protein M501DRAFT_994431 [Patellaria atrata CBS 101060]
MADPLTVLGAAAGVLQIIRFAGDLLSKGNELRQSTNGVLQKHVELRGFATRLRDLTHSLALSSVSGSSEKIHRIQEGNKRLQELCQGCNQIASQLLEVLSGLEIKGPQNSLSLF